MKLFKLQLALYASPLPGPHLGTMHAGNSCGNKHLVAEHTRDDRSVSLCLLQVAEPEAVSSTAADCAAPREQLHQTQQHLSTALGQVTEAAAEHSKLQTMLHESLQQEQQEVQIGNQQLHAIAVERGLLPEQLGNVQKELQQVEAAAKDFTIAAIHDELRAPLSHAQQEAGPTTQHAAPAAVEQAHQVQQQLVCLDAEV